MTDPAAGLSILHVIVRAGETNSQYNEHCLPVLADRAVTVCSLFPAEVDPPPALTLFEGDGSWRGCFRVLRRALDFAEYDVVHVHAPASGMVTLATYWRTRRSRRDLVFTVHNSWRSFRPRNRVFLRLIIALFPLIVVCGQAARDSMPRRVQRRAGHKIAVVPNGVDVERVNAVIDDADPPRRTGPGHAVISVGRFIPIKDPATLVRAFAEGAGRDDRLVMVGEGPLAGEVEAVAAARGVEERVRFTGLVPRDEVYRLNRAGDVFVTTSRGEGLPVAMLEAMACGLPVVASDIPPHREIAARVPGIPLVPPGDRAGFARALRRQLSLTDEDRRRIGDRLRRGVADEFSVSAMNHRYGEIYARVRAAGGARRRTLRPAVSEAHAEEPLWDRLRRHAALLVVLAVLGGAAGFLFANVERPVYKAETTLMVGSSAPVGSDDELKLSSALAVAYADLARREPVLGPVADAGFADSWRQLQPDVHVQTGTKNAQLVEVSVYSDDPAAATSLAAAVRDQLVEVAESGTTSPRRRFVREQVTGLQQAVEETASELDTVSVALASADGEERTRLQSSADQLRRDLTELQSSYAELQQLDTADAALLTPVDSPWVTRSPLRPAPLALAVAGAAVGLTLGTGWVHLFGRRRPAPPAPLPGAAAAGPVWNAVPDKKRGTRS